MLDSFYFAWGSRLREEVLLSLFVELISLLAGRCESLHWVCERGIYQKSFYLSVSLGRFLLCIASDAAVITADE